MIMDCQTYQALVAAHADAALDPQERMEADAHVSVCPGCAELRAVNKRIRAFVREHASRHTIPPEIRARVEKALDVADQPDSPVAVLSSRWRVRVVLAGAIAATLLLVIGSPFRSSPPDLLAVLAEDVRGANASSLAVELPTDNIDQLRAYYRNSGKFTFDQTVEDFGGFGLRPVGATVGDIGGAATTLTVYEGPAGKVICRRFLSGSVRLPPGGERVGEATVYTVGDVTVRVHRMGNVICVLASAMPREEFVRTLLQPMHGRQLTERFFSVPPPRSLSTTVRQ
jgi:hypothetical protein